MKYEQYAQEARRFVKEVAAELGEVDTDQAERIMISVLHTFRDLLTPEESMHLIAQFPMLLKAIYVNGWRFGSKTRVRSLGEFVEALKEKNPRVSTLDFGNNELAIVRTKAVIRVLRNHIAIGEVKDIVSQLPSELTELWLNPEENQERQSV
ncbi:MAG: DUF2267 domain-containing protein [Marivirga sp.]|nr:DUF2267 domain-containing protein [Marivirga sp.]